MTLRHSELVTKNPTLHARQHRCEARPAFQNGTRPPARSFSFVTWGKFLRTLNMLDMWSDT
jgi:hypothetical protein